MITVTFENVTEAKHREILNKILAGGFSYTPDGEQIDSETFVMTFGLGEYAVVTDEILTKEQEEVMNGEYDGYARIHDAFPRTVSVEEGEEYTVSL